MDMLVKKKGTVRSELIIPESLPVTLKFDMQRFTQVCLNLLTNALKFTDYGSISLVISYIRRDDLKESDYYPSTDFGRQLLNSLGNKGSSQDSQEIEEDLDTQIGYKMQFAREIGNLESKKKTFIGVNAPEKGFLKIEVNDTGCGINSEDLKKLFKKFTQAHPDLSQQQIGSGLGLWITKSLCGLLGGDVTAYSVPSIGSSFVAIIQADCLPSARPMRLNTSAFSPLLQSPLLSSKPEIKRILLVDDDPFNLEFHTQIIKSLGYDAIETAIDGRELLEKFKLRPEGHFEAIITDIAMPNLNGIAAAKLVRKFEDDQRRDTRVKIGFITGHSNRKDQVDCEKGPLNCLFYLSKPIKAEMIESFLPSLRDQEPLSPLKKISSNASRTSQRQQLFSSSPLILCVDDDMFNLDFLEDMFRGLGARTIKAKSGEESIGMMKSTILEGKIEYLPKFVLMDCRMPKMDGWTASKMLKEMFQREYGREIPIIGVTEDDKQQSQGKLNSSGMNELIQKPIQREELQDLLTKYV